MVKPPGICPSDPVQRSKLYRDRLEADQVLKVFKKVPFYLPGQKSMDQIPKHMHLAYQETVVLVGEQVVLRRDRLAEDAVDAP